MFGLGSWELLAILVVALLIFGHRLPSVMRSLGQSMHQFKRGMTDVMDESGSPPADESPSPASEQKAEVDPSNEDPGAKVEHQREKA